MPTRQPESANVRASGSPTWPPPPSTTRSRSWSATGGTVPVDIPPERMGQTYARHAHLPGLLGHRGREIAAYDAPVTTSTSTLWGWSMPLRGQTLRAMRDGAVVACLVLAAAHLFGLLDIGVDAYTYWT